MPPSPPSDDRITEEAADWCLRLQSDDCSDAERAAFERWYRADPAHAAEFQAMGTIWGAAAALPPRVTAGAAPPRAGLPPPAGAARRAARVPVRRWALAAGFAAVLAGGWAAGWASGVLPGRIDVALGGDVHRTVTLPDGSAVDLNVHTRLLYAEFRDRRAVVMDHGEAFFAVTHDGERPFTVHVAGRRVRVTGTKFNVWANGGTLAVTLTEGGITVTADEAAGGAAVTLTPGMQGRFARGDAEGRVARVDPDTVLSWRRGRLIIDGITLADAVPLLNPYLAQPLRLADPAVGALRIAGVYDTADLGRVVASLPRVLPVTLTPQGDGILVSAR